MLAHPWVNGRRFANSEAWNSFLDQLEQQIVYRGVGIGRDKDRGASCNQNSHCESDRPCFACLPREWKEALEFDGWGGGKTSGVQGKKGGGGDAGTTLKPTLCLQYRKLPKRSAEALRYRTKWSKTAEKHPGTACTSACVSPKLAKTNIGNTCFRLDGSSTASWSSHLRSSNTPIP